MVKVEAVFVCPKTAAVVAVKQNKVMTMCRAGLLFVAMKRGFCTVARRRQDSRDKRLVFRCRRLVFRLRGAFGGGR